MQSPHFSESVNSGKAIWVFTPSRTDPKDLEFIFVQRQSLLQDAVERVRESSLTDHKHHLLFVGPRGCGKTHLVTLIVNRVAVDETLTDHLRIAWLNEDETCTTLLEFLLKIHAALEKRYPPEYREEMLSAAYEMKPPAALEFVSKHLLTVLGSRTLLVVSENLDAIFEGLGDVGQKQLRSFIQENPRLSIVATAQRLVEDLSNRNSPFFGFFQTEHLKSLTVEQASELLQNIARLQQKYSIVEFLSSSRGRARVRAIHHLSGGNHRIYIVLSQFITRDSVDALVEPFMKMVDELTPYYQERIRWLPPMQRKIVEYLCTCEGTVPVKEIAKRLFATSQTISSQLQDLREKGYIESNQRGRESLYEISEPLMRICVEVKDNQRLQPLRLLVDFLRVWYDDRDLKLHLKNVAPASTSCEYLKSAIERNYAEGNLRKHILLANFQSSLPEELDSEMRSGLLDELNDAPEALILAIHSIKDKNPSQAIDCLEEAITGDATTEEKVRLLFVRASIHSSLKDRAKEIADYTAVINLPDASVDQVAKALYYRGVTHSQAGETQLETADYTAVINLPDAPVDHVSKALLNRGVNRSQADETQLAIADYTAVINLPDAPVDQVAQAFVNRGITHSQAGETQLAIADYTAVINMPDAPVDQVAKALYYRGLTHCQAGETQLEIADYTAVINLPDAPVDEVAMALNCRALTHSQTGETQLAIADYTAVIKMPDAPVDEGAMALNYRGITHSQVGETQLAIADYTAVINMPDAPVDQVAKALYYRGLTHCQAGETQLEIADYTAVINLPNVSVYQVAMALVNRGLRHNQAGEKQLAIADYTAVINLPDAPADQVAKALYARGVTHFQESRKEESRSDFEALICLPQAPVEEVVDAHLALSELQFSEGRWNEGFHSIEASLQCGERQQPAYRTNATDLIGVIFYAGLSPEGRRDKVAELLGLYQKHQTLPVLGEAVIQQVGKLYRAGEPFPSTDNLESWKSAWEQAAESVPDFRLSLRLLITSISFLKSGGKDRSILLDLSSAERAIVEQAMGFHE